MPTELRVKVDSRALRQLEEAYAKAPRAVASALQRTVMPNFVRKALEASNYPGPVVYPIEWKSERQRRAFFATNGFGKGIPYKRTGTLKASWFSDVKQLDDAVEAEVGNSADYARFVIWENQQPFHRNTGWTRFDLTVDALAEQAASDIASLYLDIMGNE